jgi:photosynthetic reaction center cytochrome c subunit
MSRGPSFLAAALLLLGGIASLGVGQSRGPGARSPDTQRATVTLAGEPDGASRCRVCHSAEVEGYSRSAMAHSLRRAGQEPTGTVTTPDARIAMYTASDGSWQRLETSSDTSNYHVDYVMGSGNHAFGYLIEIANHLFQSPVAFYKSRNSYDLAPGYETMQDPDFTRPVAEGCVFCHAGRALHVSGTDNVYSTPTFTAEAVSCERCHGPTGKHLADPRAGTIVNPAKLEREARDSVCEQCHLMGVTRVPNPGKEFRDFEAGKKLESTFTTYHDAVPPNTPPGTFKVISHVEQLAMSACARNSQGQLWCGTCHDPHNRPAEPVAYYRSRCLNCHTGPLSTGHPVADSNCIACHMPRRDAQDGGHTAFTDHRIQRRPEEQTKRPPDGDIAAWREPSSDLQKRNLGIAYVSAGMQRRSSDLIVRGYRLLTEVQEQFSSDPDVFTSMGTALLIGKHPSEAEFAFERVAALRPTSAVAETNLAAAYQQTGDIAGTITHLERAVALDPVHLPATSALIKLYQEQGYPAKASDLSEKVRHIMDEIPDQGLNRDVQMTHAPLPPHIRKAREVFKNLQVLKDVNSDQVLPSMRFIASALGVQCGFCHVEGHFEDDAKKEKQTARNMMRMMFAINQNQFGGTREVTCYSCHRGSPKPEGVPSVAGAAQPAAPAVDPSAQQLPHDLPTADEIVDDFIAALGGAAAVEQISTCVETGSEQVEGKSVSVELLEKDGDKELFVQHLPLGDSVRALDGDAGWASFPGRDTHDLGDSDADVARIDPDLRFALRLKQTFPELHVEYPEQVNGYESYVIVAKREGRPAWTFFFDKQSGLLVRLVRYSESPLGLDPVQIDYVDYREVGGVRIPFTLTIARSGNRSTIHVREVKQNIPIDDQRFQKPSSRTDERAQARR